MENSHDVMRTTFFNLYTLLTKNTDTFPSLHANLLANLKHIHGKHIELIAHGDSMSQLTSMSLFFPAQGGDNSLEQQRISLENPPSMKKKHKIKVSGDLHICCK